MNHCNKSDNRERRRISGHGECSEQFQKRKMVTQRNDCSCHWWHSWNWVLNTTLFFIINLITELSKTLLAKWPFCLFFYLFYNVFRQATVEELAGLGAVVHTCSRNEVELNKCFKEWQRKGFVVTGSVCDVTSPDQREALIQEVGSKFSGKLNILVSVCIKSFLFEALIISICPCDEI